MKETDPFHNFQREYESIGLAAAYQNPFEFRLPILWEQVCPVFRAYKFCSRRLAHWIRFHLLHSVLDSFLSILLPVSALSLLTCFFLPFLFPFEMEPHVFKGGFKLPMQTRDLELPILLPPPLKYQDYRHTWPCLACVVMSIKLRAIWKLDMYSMTGATSQAPLIDFFKFKFTTVSYT